MKTCDICGEKDYNCSEVFEQFQKEGVKTLCMGCAEIVNSFAAKMHDYAEAEAKKAQAAMQARLDKRDAEKRRQKAFFFLLNLRSLFKRQVIHGAFDITKPTA